MNGWYNFPSYARAHLPGLPSGLHNSRDKHSMAQNLPTLKMVIFFVTKFSQESGCIYASVYLGSCILSIAPEAKEVFPWSSLIPHPCKPILQCHLMMTGMIFQSQFCTNPGSAWTHSVESVWAEAEQSKGLSYLYSKKLQSSSAAQASAHSSLSLDRKYEMNISVWR